MHSVKTYTRASVKTDETEAIVLGGSKPVDKADSEPTEKTPDGSPPSQVNSLHLTSKFPHQNIGQTENIFRSGCTEVDSGS